MGNGGVNVGVAAVVVGASVVLDDDDVKLPVRKNSDKQHLKFSDSDVPLFW